MKPGYGVSPLTLLGPPFGAGGGRHRREFAPVNGARFGHIRRSTVNGHPVPSKTPFTGFRPFPY